MKRITILLMTLMLAIIHIAAQDTSLKGTITLSHQGKETTFAYNEMTKVMDAAADGDTVFLSAGYFQGDFVMTKKLAFIGVGADYNYGNNSNNSTVYDGKIIVRLPENTKLTARLFDKIYFSNPSFTFNSAIDNVIFRQCYWQGGGSFSLNADISYMLVDRCYCNLSIGDYNKHIKKLVARNSRLQGTPYEACDPTTHLFYNCNVSTNGGWGMENGKFSSRFLGTFYNCILNSGSWYMADINNSSTATVLINCLYAIGSEPIDQECILQNCYKYTDTDNYIFNLTKEDLQKNNYLGNDGTVVGCYGGKNPYTLDVISPTIKNTIHLDKDKKQVQFNIKITEQQ